MPQPATEFEIKGEDITLLDAAMRILTPTSQLERQRGGFRTRLIPSVKGTYQVKLYNLCWEQLTRQLIKACGFEIVTDPGPTGVKQEAGPSSRTLTITFENRPPVELTW